MAKNVCLNDVINIESLKEGIIYHYTSAEGLLSILENCEIWATNSNFLNDKSEFIYTYKLFYEKILKEIKNEKIKTIMINRFNYNTCDPVTLDANDIYTARYIISFSKSPDNLLLWSEFSGNTGYNIGFDISKLKDKLNNLWGFDGKVIYNKERQIELLKNVVSVMLKETFQDKNINSLDDLSDNINVEDIQKMLPVLHNIIELYSMFFKQSEFEQEEEYRLVIQVSHGVPSRLLCANESGIFFKETNNKMYFRVKEGMLSPFVKVPFWDLDSLESITIGPKNNIDIAKMGLEIYCRNKGINPKILKSNIPLRY